MKHEWPEFAVLCGAVGPQGPQGPQRLRGLHGDPYAQARDRLLADGSTAARVTKYLGDPDWPTRTLAAIVQGWCEHAALYRQVLAELDQVNVAGESRTVTGISRIWTKYRMKARDEYHEAILPLCWEVLLAFGDVWPTWKVITFLEMIGGVPKAASVEVVLVFMRDVAPLELIDAAANTLRDLPPADVEPALVAHTTALAAALAARGSVDPRAAALLRVWHKLLQDLADDRAQQP